MIFHSAVLWQTPLSGLLSLFRIMLILIVGEEGSTDIHFRNLTDYIFHGMVSDLENIRGREREIERGREV